MSLLGDLKHDVTAALTGELRPATLWVHEVEFSGSGQPIDVWNEDHDCEGVAGTFDIIMAASGLVALDAAKVEILASSLAVEPGVDDKIELDGQWWIVRRVQRDPAGAWWTLECAETEAVEP